MQYNKLGRTGLDVSIISLGMEHVTSPEKISPVVHRAIDGGINYLDLMIWSPELKDALGRALKGHRDNVILAGHLGVAETNGQYRRSRDIDECEVLWHDWLARLGVDCIDILHLTYVDEDDDYEQVVGPGGVLELALRLQQAGKTRFIGLSGHTPQIALRAIEDGHLDVLMHPVNIAWDAEPRRGDVFRLCASQGVGLVAMKAFGGGELFQRDKPLSPIQCLGYTLSQPGVATALVGARSLEELETDLQFLEATDEAKDFSTIIEDFRQGLEGTCVYCNHCLPCPSEIDIAAVIRMLTTAQYSMSDQLWADYGALLVNASDCIECGDCMARCPFGVDVVSKMEQAVELFGG